MEAEATMATYCNRRKLEGKVAIITGGASGIGSAIARLFASHGGTVIISDIVDDALGCAVTSSVSPPGSCTFLHCDVREELHLASSVDYSLASHGRLDVMLSNAGTAGRNSDFVDLDAADFDYVLAINVRGSTLAIRHAALAMEAGGSIICTASVAAVQGGFVGPAYTAAKQAVVGLAKAAAAEFGEKGVRVNCVSPFLVATPLTCRTFGLDKEKQEEISRVSATLKGAGLRAEDVAAVVLFLASDDAAFVSGHNLIVDGAVTPVNRSLRCVFIEILGGKEK